MKRRIRRFCDKLGDIVVCLTLFAVVVTYAVYFSKTVARLILANATSLGH